MLESRTASTGGAFPAGDRFSQGTEKARWRCSLGPTLPGVWHPMAMTVSSWQVGLGVPDPGQRAAGHPGSRGDRKHLGKGVLEVLGWLCSGPLPQWPAQLSQLCPPGSELVWAGRGHRGTENCQVTAGSAPDLTWRLTRKPGLGRVGGRGVCVPMRPARRSKASGSDVVTSLGSRVVRTPPHPTSRAKLCRSLCSFSVSVPPANANCPASPGPRATPVHLTRHLKLTHSPCHSRLVTAPPTWTL